jgi:hypothetical protein
VPSKSDEKAPEKKNKALGGIHKICYDNLVTILNLIAPYLQKTNLKGADHPKFINLTNILQTVFPKFSKFY